MKAVIFSALLAVIPVMVPGQEAPPQAPVAQHEQQAKTADPTKLAAPAPGMAKPAGAAPVNDKAYVIGAEDKLDILVWGNAPLTGSVTVRPDGVITLGLINEVKAAGLTPEQLTDEITRRLKDGGYMQSPRVTVAVAQVNSKKACIVGEVFNPGCFNLVIDTNVLEALVNAGGFKDFANQTHIVIQRGEKRFPFNYKRVIAGKSREQNIQLEPGDLIIVK